MLWPLAFRLHAAEFTPELKSNHVMLLFKALWWLPRPLRRESNSLGQSCRLPSACSLRLLTRPRPLCYRPLPTFQPLEPITFPVASWTFTLTLASRPRLYTPRLRTLCQVLHVHPTLPLLWHCIACITVSLSHLTSSSKGTKAMPILLTILFQTHNVPGTQQSVKTDTIIP